MSWIKVIGLNIFITFGLLGILLLAPPIFYQSYSFMAGESEGSGSADKRHELSLYSDIPWAEQHFVEFSELSTTYYDFITWRRDDFIGKTINIKDGVRLTKGSRSQNGRGINYYFFGGSTTWGTGVDDANTYPSLFSKRTNSEVLNLGESGYIARQSLAYLNNIIIKHKFSNLTGKHFVFYDGVNDVAYRCRTEITDLGTGREQQIRDLLPDKPSEQFGFLKTFEQLTEFLLKVTHKLSFQDDLQLAETAYSCSLDPKRAEEVARTLVDTWQAASDLVTTRGGSFTAILQPVAYLGNPNVDYLKLDRNSDLVEAKQFEAVYPLIKKIAESKDIKFLDFSNVYESCDNCYIDFCHVGPQAHQVLVRNLVKYLVQ